MKENVILVLKGILIGIGKIIPGVSGSMLAILLNVYDEAIDCIIHINYKNIKYLATLGIGILSSIILMSKGINYLLDNYYAFVMFLFIGFISGSSVSLISESKLKKNYFYFIVPILFLIILEHTATGIDIPKNTLFYFFIGGIEALTMIIPGISGTAVLMILNYYDKVLESFSCFDLSFLIPFFIGLGIISLLTIRIIDKIYKNYIDKFNSIVFGFSIGSIILLIMNVWDSIFNVYVLFFGMILLLIGFIIPLLLDKIKV